MAKHALKFLRANSSWITTSTHIERVFFEVLKTFLVEGYKTLFLGIWIYNDRVLAAHLIGSNFVSRHLLFVSDFKG